MMSRSGGPRRSLGASAACVRRGRHARPARAAYAGATWRLEQPTPPPAPAGVPGSSTPIGLGRVGDIEFWAPNRGLLITAGNPPTIPPGVWAYNGVRMARARDRLRGKRRAHRLGGTRRILDRLGRAPRTDERISANPEPPAPGRQHALSLRRRPGRRLLRAPRLPERTPIRRCTLQAASIPPTAGSPANRLKNRRSAPSSCTGTVPPLEAEPYAGEGHAVRGHAPV